MPLIFSDSPNLLPLFDEIAPNSLTVMHAFTSIFNISDAKNDVTQSNVQETANDVRKILKNITKWQLFASLTPPTPYPPTPPPPPSDLLQNKTQFIFHCP